MWWLFPIVWCRLPEPEAVIQALHICNQTVGTNWFWDLTIKVAFLLKIQWMFYTKSSSTPIYLTWPPVVMPHIGWSCSLCAGVADCKKSVLTPRPSKATTTVRGACSLGDGGASCLPDSISSNLFFSTWTNEKKLFVIILTTFKFFIHIFTFSASPIRSHIWLL